MLEKVGDTIFSSEERSKRMVKENYERDRKILPQRKKNYKKLLEDNKQVSYQELE
jgi:hypothetical protein